MRQSFWAKFAHHVPTWSEPDRFKTLECFFITSPQIVEQIKKLEQVQRRATKYILNLPFNCEVSYKDRLIQCNLTPLTYWHEYLDIVFYFKLINKLITLDTAFLPKLNTPMRTTRMSIISGGTKFEELDAGRKRTGNRT